MFLAVLQNSGGSSAMDERASRSLHASAYSHMGIVISLIGIGPSASITNRDGPPLYIMDASPSHGGTMSERKPRRWCCRCISDHCWLGETVC